MKTVCQHHTVRSESAPRPYQYCVKPDFCRPVAHGGYTVTQRCYCGAHRLVNINGCASEASDWSE
jgi:hypothetical protein